MNLLKLYEKNLFKVYRYTDILGGILLVLGLFYLFAPHTWHEMIEYFLRIPLRPAHILHQISGAVMIALGSFIWWYNNKLLQRNK